jgi:23S rRNA (adenine2503-C2)-methyltransferase
MTKNIKYDLKCLSFKEIETIVAELNIETYRAKQISQWVFQNNAVDIEDLTNISIDIRKKLHEIAFISSLGTEKIYVSKDGSKKFLFRTNDGYGIESVIIPEKAHFTLCISTQIGCPLRCRFCYTGRNGLVRNLSVSEIINQVSAVLKAEDLMKKPPNIVFMGMGEPLSNYENTVKSLQILLNPWGFNFSHRKITVSTAGVIPKLKELGSEAPVNLAVSLNAPNNMIRNFLMPVNKKFPIQDLIEAVKHFPMPSRKRVTFEYILIKDVNDSLKNAIELGKLLKTIRCKINLIPFNEHPEVQFKRPEEKKIIEFQSVLRSLNFTAPIRMSKGSDISAACGQLGGNPKSFF